jgi:hypothetical protein
MYLPLCAQNCLEILERGGCIQFAVTADKWLCVVNALDGQSL